MSGRVLDFAMHTHEEALRLLPWLANDTLDAGQREWVQRHLEGCAQCRRELRETLDLRTAILGSMHESGDVDSGWRRMRSRIAVERGVGLRTSVARDSRRRRMPRWVAWAVAAQALQLAAFAAAAWWLHPRPAAYHTLGSSVASPAGDLLVLFDPSISEARLRRLLDSSGARIVDGPTDAGAYVLAVPAGRANAVRDALRASPGVTMVESLREDR